MNSTPLHAPQGAPHTAVEALAALASAAPDARVLRRLAARANRPPRAAATRKRRIATLGAGARLNLTPMIDVVFQLLVFFIATTRFVTNEHVLRMDLPPRTAAPAGASAAAADPFAYIEDALRIEVLPGGGVRARAPVATATNAEELRLQLAQVRRDNDNPAGALPVTFPIVLAPAEGATWQDAVEVLNATAAAGYRNVGFAQKPGERAP